MAKMNYNGWFYDQHKYFKGSRTGITDFIDNKWVNINDRFRSLMDMESELIAEQPFMINGNNTGFDKLIDLMGRSNYTFEDLDESMKETYRVSLQNAMSRNLVNTHAVMFHTNNMDKKNVTSDKFTHYRIIEAPFNQLHFGHRDEFIRQKLQEMHSKAFENYVPIDKFNTSEFTKILDFSIICTVNGYFCNDCKVAISDKGFKFKVGWPYASDVDFIVYKLDHAQMFSINIPVSRIRNNNTIPYSVMGITPNNLENLKCIINIYDKGFARTVPTAPNFGVFTQNGLLIKNLQKVTENNFERFYGNKDLTQQTITVDIYALKFFQEIPDLYPAINYIDLMDNRVVYNERYEYIKTPEGDKVVATSTKNINYLETCTPPIAIDRNTTYSFDIIVKCLSMYDYLMQFNDDMVNIGQCLLYGSEQDFVGIYKPKLNEIYQAMILSLKDYQQGAIITSLISSEKIEKFETLITNIKNLASLTDFSLAQQYVFDELYDTNYRATLKDITEPFRSEVLAPFITMKDMKPNYFVDDNSTRFNRPISEECFIALRYHRDDECWLFDYPEIKHFHGIGNTFYINTNLKGDEIFKFFVLYSDNESPSETEIEHFDLDTVLDFDLFMTEVNKHMGYIRYWDVENRLLKMTKMLYDRYDDETCVQVLSKILKRKISGDDFIKVYPSDINYEDSNKTSDNVDNYTENSERGPFGINFLFYTLSMLNNNEDKLQSYFYHYLTDKKFDKRYGDVDISSVVKGDKYPLNYSEFTIAPSQLSDTSVRPARTVAFYGVPLLLDSSGSDMYTPYRYVMNVYKPEIKYPSLKENGLDDTYYAQYNEIESYGGSVVSYHDDIYLGKLMTKYLCSVYDYISTLQTNYKESYNQSSVIESAIKTINEHIKTINDFLVDANIIDIDEITNPNLVSSLVTIDNEFLSRLNTMKTLIDDISTVILVPKTNIVAYINSTVLSTLKHVYVTTGFDNNAMKRARMLYIHFKKINSPMNPYQFKKWLDGIDMYILEHLDELLAANENYDLGSNTFRRMYDVLNEYITRLNATNSIQLLDDEVKDLTESLHTNHIEPIVQYCDDIINKLTFDLFTINSLNFDTNIKYNVKPAYMTITLPYSDYTHPPVGLKINTPITLIFQPIIDIDGPKYVIKSFANICEYIFFKGESMSNVAMNILDSNGSVISTQHISIDFTRTSSTADNVNTFYQIANVNTEAVEFQNTHESFEVVNNLVVNEKHADMNYELLVGNQFTPLDHEIEMILEPETWLPGSVDRLCVENQLINRMTMLEFGHRKCTDIFFKPSQVMHIEYNNNGSIDSVYGKYFEGQSIYLKTTDGLCIFPVKITAVDHSVNKGFIEAKVDGWNSKWFKISDPAKITEYLKYNIECEVMNDNMRNFLDEFSDGDFQTYFNPGYSPTSVVYDENIDNAYKLPGDPIFVSSNADFVYTRLNWIFNDLVPNRFIDEEHKTHKFMYITAGFINNENDELKINMINHNFNNTSLPERYPALRDEPNDHEIWNKEIITFTTIKDNAYNNIYRDDGYMRNRIQAEYALEHAKTIYEREYYIELIDSYDRKIARAQELIDRLTLYIRQLEKPTTWFNVRSFEATLVYIANGRADKFSPHFVSNIRDLIYTDKVDVFLYDWEHKHWLDPSTYEMETEFVDAVKIDECDDYTTNRVLYTFTIKPLAGFEYSNKILVYFSYDKSDIFDDIEMNPPTCQVKFKPLLSLDNKITDYDPYKEINIRKHFDGYEEYTVDSEDIHVKRVKRSGKYTYAPTFRVCDILIHDDNGDHTYEDIDEFLVPNQFGFNTTQRMLCTPQYEITIHSEIDSFEVDKEVKLICINNNGVSSYDGNISSIMFTAVTSEDNGEQHIDIIGSTLPNYVTGSFVCTVFKDDRYRPVGGVITVTITNTQESIFGEWIRVPMEYMTYREVPNEFKLVMKVPTTGDTIVTLKNQYIKDIDDTVSLDNSGLNNPYEYYYDQKHHVRLPISNVRINEDRERLVIDTSLNENIKLIKAPYIGICRYSVNRIPENGLIDLTGYLPTPLSRDRYEFWINGRCINNTKDLIILSPTSIQLCNMKSLRNFEVVELVDDVNVDNDLFRKGNVYIDINGNSYSTYRLAMLSNNRIHKQDIKFVFNANVHKRIHDYTKNIIPRPNNKDYEEDILSYVTFTDTIDSYEQLYNIPTLNGVTLFHPKLNDLGITEVPSDDLIKEFDKVWKYEELTNPLFVTTHREGSHANDDILKTHIKLITEPHWNGLEIDTSGMYLIYATGPVEKYFSFYISKTSDGAIDDVDNTVKIIPFIMPGVYVLIDHKYEGMWIHCTHGRTKPIHIVNTTPEK